MVLCNHCSPITDLPDKGILCIATQSLCRPCWYPLRQPRLKPPALEGCAIQAGSQAAALGFAPGCALLFVFYSELGPHFALITHGFFFFFLVYSLSLCWIFVLRSLEWCVQREQQSCRSGKGTCVSSVCEQKCRCCNCDTPVNLCLPCNSSSHRLLAGGSHMGSVCTYKQLCAHLS